VKLCKSVWRAPTRLGKTNGSERKFHWKCGNCSQAAHLRHNFTHRFRRGSDVQLNLRTKTRRGRQRVLRFVRSVRFLGRFDCWLTTSISGGCGRKGRRFLRRPVTTDRLPVGAAANGFLFRAAGTVLYPASSPYVVASGHHTLTNSDFTYNTKLVGSQAEAYKRIRNSPFWQSPVSPTSAVGKGVPDVSMDADLASGA